MARRRWLISVAAVAVLLLVGEAAFRLFPLDPQLDYEFDEELYWRLKPEQTGRLWMGGGVFRSPLIHIGKDGFREGGGAGGEGGSVTCLFLGDSYTFGLGVEDSETFGAVAGRTLMNQGLVPRNGGNPGYGVFQSAALLKRELAAGRVPELVVLTIPTGDVLRQPFSAEEFARYRDTQTKRKRLRELSRLATFVYRKIVHLRRRSAEEPKAVPNERSARAIEAFRGYWEADAARIREMKTLCDERGAALAVLHWPQSAGEGWNEIVAAGIESLAKETGLVGLTGLEEPFAGHSRAELTIPGDGHPSVLAHRLVADYLADELAPLLRRGSGTQKPAHE